MSVTRIGSWPWDLPERIVRWPALAASNAMSAPECDRPTTRTGPSLSCAGLRYSCECSCRIDGSSSAANAGTLRLPERPRRDDDLACGEAPAVRGRHEEAAVDRLDAIDARPAPDGQVELPGVRLEVVGHLATGRPVRRRRGEAHARERVVAGRAVQPERVPAVPPVVADARVGVEDREGQAARLQVVPGRQAGLAGPDDDRVDPLHASCVRPWLLPSVSRVRRRPGLIRSPCRPLGVGAGGAHRRNYPNRAATRHGYRGSDEAVLVGEGRRPGPRRHIELRVDVADVPVDGPLADPERPSAISRFVGPPATSRSTSSSRQAQAARQRGACRADDRADAPDGPASRRARSNTSRAASISSAAPRPRRRGPARRGRSGRERAPLVRGVESPATGPSPAEHGAAPPGRRPAASRTAPSARAAIASAAARPDRSATAASSSAAVAGRLDVAGREHDLDERFEQPGAVHARSGASSMRPADRSPRRRRRRPGRDGAGPARVGRAAPAAGLAIVRLGRGAVTAQSMELGALVVAPRRRPARAAVATASIARCASRSPRATPRGTA